MGKATLIFQWYGVVLIMADINSAESLMQNGVSTYRVWRLLMCFICPNLFHWYLYLFSCRVCIEKGVYRFTVLHQWNTGDPESASKNVFVKRRIGTVVHIRLDQIQHRNYEKLKKIYRERASTAERLFWQVYI